MRFDIAIWRTWPHRNGEASLPEIALIEAPNAFTAVVGVMRLRGLGMAGHVAAKALDGSIVYRAYGVMLAPDKGGG